jgi:hypothetical protein
MLQGNRPDQQLKVDLFLKKNRPHQQFYMSSTDECLLKLDR